jgi:hypothetical protein
MRVAVAVLDGAAEGTWTLDTRPGNPGNAPHEALPARE